MSRYFVTCKCGGKAELYVQPLTAPVCCPLCQAVLKPEEHPIRYDYQRYRILVDTGDPADLDQVKTIAQLTNLNYLQAREILEKGGGPVFEGDALDTWGKRIELESLGLRVSIEPPFPWADL